MVEPYYQDEAVVIYHGNCLDVLPENTIVRPPTYKLGKKTCRVCAREYARRWREQKGDEIRARRRATYDPEKRRQQRLARAAAQSGEQAT